MTTETKTPRARKADTAAAKAEAKGAARKGAAKPEKAAKPVTATGGGIDALKEAAKRYQHNKEVKTAGGHVSVNNGDELAVRLQGKTLDEVYAFAAKQLKVDEAELRTRYAHLNVGMQRMNLGNKVRAAAK